MGMFKIKISGIDEAINEIIRFDKEARVAVRSQVKKSANAIRKAAKERAPEGDTGELKKGIRAKYSSDGLSAEIAPNQWYAHFPEFGTQDTPAQPFMLPAYEQEKDNYIDGMKDAIKGAVN